MVMTDYKFQEMLNRIPFTADKTLLDRFLELVNSILSSIGFSVNENSVLKAAVENTVELINLGNKEYVEETIDLQSTKENTIFVERKMEPAVLTNKKPYILPDGRTINFNEQQSQAIDDINAFLDSDNRFYTLSGYAGTGKTTIIKSILDTYRGRGTVAVSAPTHKAKKVISKTTKRSAYTIQSLLGLQPNTDLENFNINKPQFDAKAPRVIERFDLIILDEASMLNKDLFKMLTTEAEKAGAKIIFMGDEAQLPPVNEGISDVFTSNKISGISKLSKVERQAGDNPLMSIYDKIRNNIDAAKDSFEHSTALNSKEQGVSFVSGLKDFTNKVISAFNSSSYKEDKNFAKLLTWTNADVKYWNEIIRNSIPGTETAPLVKGDLLMAYNTVTLNQNEVLIENSSDYEVVSVYDNKTSYGIPVYNVGVKNIDDEYAPKKTINIVKAEGVEAFVAKHQELLNTAIKLKGRAWIEYFSFKRQHLLLEDIKASNGTLIVKKDVDYGYAITVHKSQGSTYTNVFINEDNLDRNNNNEERNKLKYVALSRPTDQASVLSQKATGNVIDTDNKSPVSSKLPELKRC